MADKITAKLVFDTSKSYQGNRHVRILLGNDGYIDWGDGSPTQQGTWDTRYSPPRGTSWSNHTYADTGIYNVTIYNTADIIVSSTSQPPLYNTRGWTSAEFSEDVTKIRQGMFYYSLDFTKIIFKGTITEIGYCAFVDINTNLTLQLKVDPNITIPARAFGTSAGISDLVFIGSEEDFANLVAHTSTDRNNGLLGATVHYAKSVSYQTNGGILESGFDNPFVSATNPDPLPTVTKNNYLFGGWYSDNSTFNNQLIAGASIPIGVEVFYAKLYNTVTYNLNGGVNSARNKNFYTSRDVELNAPLYAPTKDGYDFDGWYTDAAFTQPISTVGELIGDPLVLYAKFREQVFYNPKQKTAEGIENIPMNAERFRGHDAYISVNMSSIEYMQDLYALVTEINAKNQHAIFDASSFIEGAYVCTVRLYEKNGLYFAEINDLLNHKTYYNTEDYDMLQTVESYISSCVAKDEYTNISISSLTTMGELKSFIDTVNADGNHCLFDFSHYISGAYVCTVQMYTMGGTNYCYIFDILDGKLYGSYTGYIASTTIANYVQGTVSDIIHAIKITEDISLQDLINMINRVNINGHHVMFDISALSLADYLITFTYSVDGSNTTCKAMGLVNGTKVEATYATSALSSTLLSTFMADTVSLATMDDIPEIPTKTSDLTNDSGFIDDTYHDTNKENVGKITIGGTEYEVRTSTTDAGAAGYITFVVEA